MKTSCLPLTLMLLTFVFSANAQSVIIPKSLNLPKDTIVANQLISSLNGLLSQKDSPNRDNKYVLKADLLEMSQLLDEFKGMEKSAVCKDDHFFQAYLSNMTAVSDSTYLIQVSYAGIDDKTAVLRAVIRLMAKRQGDRFYFYSTLKQNTAAWKIKKMSYMNFHYKTTLNTKEANAYLKTVDFYNSKLKAAANPTEFYFCDDFPEVMQVSGVDYKADYVGIEYNDLGSHENDADLEVNGGYYGDKRFDRHDLWHARLRTVLAWSITNRPVDEGCAYLYGGSWGTDWDEVLAMFKKYAASHPNADWMKLYINSDKLRDDDKPIYFCYAINALIVRKIDKEKGFAPVMELLSCGKRENGDENYFKALEKITGINKANFSATVSGLIKE